MAEEKKKKRISSFRGYLSPPQIELDWVWAGVGLRLTNKHAMNKYYIYNFEKTECCTTQFEMSTLRPKFLLYYWLCVPIALKYWFDHRIHPWQGTPHRVKCGDWIPQLKISYHFLWFYFIVCILYSLIFPCSCHLHFFDDVLFWILSSFFVVFLCDVPSIFEVRFIFEVSTFLSSANEEDLKKEDDLINEDDLENEDVREN